MVLVLTIVIRDMAIRSDEVAQKSPLSESILESIRLVSTCIDLGYAVIIALIEYVIHIKLEQ